MKGVEDIFQLHETTTTWNTIAMSLFLRLEIEKYRTLKFAKNLAPILEETKNQLDNCVSKKMELEEALMKKREIKE